MAWLYLNDRGVVLIRVGGIKIYRGSSCEGQAMLASLMKAIIVMG